ncbi:uncharacterized protein VP01_4577g3, partial [Puccinia sorghi]
EWLLKSVSFSLLTKKFLLNSMSKIPVTLNACTSPNWNAFLGVTIHGINSKFSCCFDQKGQHTGNNLADILVGLFKDYNITTSLHKINAENVSNNSTLAQAVEHSPTFSFQSSIQLFGCMAHVINLAACDGLLFFGKIVNSDCHATNPTY